MANIIMHRNASPVHGFLSLIEEECREEGVPLGGKILDCGAGGRLPPLALFHQHGLDCWGIDTSEDQIALAKEFGQQHGMDLDLRLADMRYIPFEDQHFDYVYEHFAMCHLGKRDTIATVQEMQRILKPGGLCFFGVISTDSWPHSIFGEEREPGEFWGEEADGEEVGHSIFSDDEADALTVGWALLHKEKRTIYLRRLAESMTLESWMDLRPDGWISTDWRDEFSRREAHVRYVHLYYQLRKKRE